MKFVALALALLLAVGSQAASLQPEPPSQLQHVRAAMDVYLTQLKDSANKVLSQLDDTEYKELKASLSQRLEDMHTQIKTLQGAVSPYTDNVFTTIADATADFRTSVLADIDALKADLEPKRAHLRDVITRHLNDYHEQMGPIVKEYHAKHTAEMDAMKAKLEPIIEQLHAKVAHNVEETKTALMPIVEAVRAKVAERLENLKEIAAPYVNEYKEQIMVVYDQAQSVKAEELASLKEKLAPMAEEVRANLQKIFDTISATYNKT